MTLSIKQKLLLLSLVPVVVLGVVLTAFTVFQVNQLAENRLDSSRTLLVDDREHEAKSLVEIAVSLVKPIYENGGSRDEAVFPTVSPATFLVMTTTVYAYSTGAIRRVLATVIGI